MGRTEGKKGSFMVIRMRCRQLLKKAQHNFIGQFENLVNLPRAKCPKFVHLSSLLNLSRHPHIKIILWPALLIKHINVEPKKKELMKK